MVNFNIQISNAPVKLLPAFMWFYKIQAFQDSTNARGQETNWTTLLLSYDNLLPTQFRTMGQSMLVDPMTPGPQHSHRLVPITFMCHFTIIVYSLTLFLRHIPKI